MKIQIAILCLLAFVGCTKPKGYKTTMQESMLDSSSTNKRNKPIGNTFEVSDVEMAKTLLLTDTALNILENKVGSKVLFFPEEQYNLQLVNCPNNGLVQTLQECYDNHRPLILSPDAIWLAITQGVSIHINEHYDSLKTVIFNADKPDKLIVRNDSLEYNQKHWETLISSLANKTREYTNGNFYSFFVPHFSTTSPVNTTTFQLTMLDSYKKGFEYVAETGCGIPSITLAGTKDDWQAIYNRLDMLNNLGLANWSENLKPIIVNFINAHNGKPDKEFWQSIYKNSDQYSRFFISGWIIKFFPYIKVTEGSGEYDDKRGVTKMGSVFIPNEFMNGSRFLQSTLSTDNFPLGISKIDILWNNHLKNTTTEMVACSGFMAIKQYPDKSLEPYISWVITEKADIPSNHKTQENKQQDVKHSAEFWSPTISREPIDSAIYDIKQFKTYRSSINFVTQILKDSLRSSEQFNTINLSADTLEFVVYTNGTIDDVTIKGINKSNKQLQKYMTKQLSDLPQKWFPALAHSYEVFDNIGASEEWEALKVRANSVVQIRFEE